MVVDSGIDGTGDTLRTYAAFRCRFIRISWSFERISAKFE